MNTKTQPNLTRLEIDITYKCNVKCPNCNRNCSQAPSDEEIDRETMQKHINEWIEIKHPWYRICILGGEPTLHSCFEDIIDLLVSYKLNHNNGLQLAVCSSMFGDYTQKKIKWVQETYKPGIINIITSPKMAGGIDLNGKPISFRVINVAAKDIASNVNMIYEGCRIANRCGIGLNNTGYYCCPISAGFHRVFDISPVATSIKDLTFGKCLDSYGIVCPLCGYSHNTKTQHELELSPTWKSFLDKYNDKY